MPCRLPLTPVTGPAVLTAFRAACAVHGVPASTLTDNGFVFTTRFAGGRGGRNGLEERAAPPRHHPEERQAEPPPDPGESRTVPADPQELAPRPAPPARHPRRPAGPARCLHQIYNTQRPHRSLPHRATPATAYTARPKAHPGDRAADTHWRVRTDRVDTDGKLTLRVGGKLHHIGIGRTTPEPPSSCSSTT